LLAHNRALRVYSLLMIPLQKLKEFRDLSSGSCAQMRLRGHHLGTAAGSPVGA
jgi:hypothetical protein